MVAPVPVLANPSGGRVRAGAADIARNGSTLTVRQHTERAIIDWRDFSIGKGELTRFRQPGATSAVLNRVTGGDPSAILGRLRANGQVYLINPNGVLVGQGATIQAQSFVASTLDVSNQAFMAGGDLVFQGDSDAAVVNQGDITALSGDVFLIAHRVENTGTIEAAEGTAGLAAGSEVLLTQAGDERLFVQAGKAPGAGEIAVDNAGLIEAAQAELKAAGGNVYALAINNDGVVRATGVAHRGGRVYLVAEGGTVTHRGAIEGGDVRLLGDRVSLESGASVVAPGGSVMIGGDRQGLNPEVKNAQMTFVGAGVTVSADAVGEGDGGRVVIYATDATWVHGQVSARGAGSGRGGFIETSGGFLDISATPDAGAGGLWLIDPYNIEIVAGSTQSSIAGSPDWTSTGNSAQLGVDAIISALGGGSDVTITTGAGGSQAGDITWTADMDYNGVGTGGTLTLSAHNDITINGAIFQQAPADDTLHFVLRADSDADGAGTVNFGAGGSITADNGGSVTVYYNPASYASPTDFSASVTAGSLTAYMLVNGANDLQAISTNLAGTYALNADIDASGIANFDPIGDSSNPFTGVFDGDGHTISGLTIDRSGTDYVGLFGYLSGAAEVRDVGLIDVDITGGFAVGGLVGRNEVGTISNAYATGAVTGSGGVGGLVGVNNDTISDAYATGEVTGSGTYAGGLVGYNSGTIERSYATGEVNSSGNYVGGLVGYNHKGIIGDGAISQSYATGAVSGDYSVGGLVGYNSGGTIEQAYATGEVIGNSSVGGLVGSNGGTVTASFWDTETTGQSASDGGTGKTTAALMQQATYTNAGWDFTDDWFLIDGQTRPFLRSEYSTTITNAHQLQLMAMDLDGEYTLAADLDLSELQDPAQMWGEAGFAPVGTYNSDASGAFEGVFDGGGHTLRNLFIDRSGTDYVGLFGGARGATIRDVTLDGGSVSGHNYVGALAAYFNTGGSGVGDSLITGVSSTVDVTGTGDNIGGLVGEFRDGTLENAWAGGDVTGQDKVGGLVGWNSGGEIAQVYATGEVNGGDNVGGLVGEQRNDPNASITDAYATGTVTGSGNNVGGLAGYVQGGAIGQSYASGAVAGMNYVGGLVGNNHGTIDQSYATATVISSGTYTGGLVGGNFGGTISQSYATGAVSGSYAGGLAGANTGTISQSYATGAVSGSGLKGGLVPYNTGTVTASFWNTGTTGQNTSAGGTGKNTTQMMQQATFSGWDFTGVWAIDEEASFPYFQWRYPNGVQAVSGGIDGAAAGQSVTLAADGAKLGSLTTFADGSFYHLLDAGTVGADSGLLIWGGGGNAFGMSDGDAADFTGLDLAASRLLVNSPLAEASHAGLATAKGTLTDAEILYSVNGGDLTLDSGVSFELASGSSYSFAGDLTTDADITLNGTSTASTGIALAGDNVTLGGDFTLSNAGDGLTIQADGSISVASGVSITTTGGDVTLNSDRDASGAGAITMASGSSIVTRGGDILMVGGNTAPGTVTDPAEDDAAFLSGLLASGARGSGGHGITISGATLDASDGNGGHIELRGVGDDGYDGVYIADGSTLITNRDGDIAIYGVGGDSGDDNDGVNITGDTTNLTGVNSIVTLYGLGRGANAGRGVVVDGEGGSAIVTTGDGALLVSGVSQATGSAGQGVALVSGGVLRTTDNGDIVVVGEGSGTTHGHGVFVYDKSIVQTTGGGNIILVGYGSTTGTLTNNEGVKLQDQSLVEIQTGSNRDLIILGAGGTGTDYNIGVHNHNSTVRMAAGVTGTMTVHGNGGGSGAGTGNWGILAENNGVYESLGAADILFSGGNGTGTDNAGIKVTSGTANRIGAATMTGDITLLTDNIDLEGIGTISVQGNGDLLIEPLSGGGSIGLGDGAAGMLHLNNTELSRIADGFASITIGLPDGSGDIDVRALSMSDPLTIRTRSGSISVNGDITTTADLTLRAGSKLDVLADINAGGAVALLVGQAGSGGTLTLNGEVTATDGFTITGGKGDDIFHINTLVTDLTLAAGDGDDIVNTRLFAEAKQNLDGGGHTTGDILNIDGQGATINGEDSPITADGFGTLTHSQFENVNVTNATIDDGGSDDGEDGDDNDDDPAPGRYEAINDTTGQYLVEHRTGGQDRNLTDEMRDAADVPTTVEQPGPFTGSLTNWTLGGLGLRFGYERGEGGGFRGQGQGQLGGQGQQDGWLIGASSFDLFDNNSNNGSNNTEPSPQQDPDEASVE